MVSWLIASAPSQAKRPTICSGLHSSAGRGIGVGFLGPIRPVVGRAIALELPPNGAAVAPEGGRNGGRGPPLAMEEDDGVPFPGGDLAVGHE